MYTKSLVAYSRQLGCFALLVCSNFRSFTWIVLRHERTTEVKKENLQCTPDTCKLTMAACESDGTPSHRPASTYNILSILMDYTLDHRIIVKVDMTSTLPCILKLVVYGHVMVG
mgnify:CR=1 FL=1